MRLICAVALLSVLGCSQTDSSLTPKDSVHVHGASGDHHPLVCGEGGDFPDGRELAFKEAESAEFVHAVFPPGVTPPKTRDGEFLLHGHYQGIQNWGRYTAMIPKKDYRYFVVSSWERMK